MRTSSSEVEDLETIPLGDETRRAQPSESWNRTSALPSARLTATFIRIIDLHPSRLPDLKSWWSSRAKHGRVRINRLSLETPWIDAGDAMRLHGRLRAGRLGRSIPVELTLWPWLGEWTKMSLEPQRHVVMTRSYFRRGHRALDLIAARLAIELRAA
jgi:hypothetical protein